MRFSEGSRPFCLATALAAALALAACDAPEPQVPPQGYPPGQIPPQGAYPQGYPPGQVPQQSAYPQPPPYRDAINTLDMPVLRTTAGGVLTDLINALPPASQARVKDVPFFTDSSVGEVNAYAACVGGKPLMAITDGLLQIEAYIAQFRATDELYGTQKVDAYLNLFAQQQKPHQPIVAPPSGFIDPAQHVDPRKVARQRQLMEEQLAFVLGHELAHHHMGHTGCAGGQGGDRQATSVGDLARLASQIIPIANQPNEAAADYVGVGNLLTAGARRQGYHWTEQGAFLTLQFFARLDQLTMGQVLTSFLNSHPNPALRVPGVNDAAACFRRTGAACQGIYPVLP